MINWLRRPPWPLIGTVALALMTGLVTFVLVRGSALPENPSAVPEAEALHVSLLLFGDLFAGLLALLLLPFAVRKTAEDGDRAEKSGRVPRSGWVLSAGILVIATTAVSTLAVPASLIVLVSFASRRPVAWFASGMAVCVLAGWFNVSVVEPEEPLPLWTLLFFALGVAGITGLIGFAQRSRRALMQSLRQEAAGAQRERKAHIDQVRTAERTHIAREMHDTLSHRLSLISLHAGALEYRPDLDAGTVQQTARVLGEAARTASHELRSVLTVLREDAPAGGPNISLSALEDLVTTARAAGTSVDFEPGGELARTVMREVPSVTSRAVYRITQECLTNALKHSPGESVRIRLHGSRLDGVTLIASNRRSSGPASEINRGFGLIGLAERVQLLNGRLHIDSMGERFTVTAWLPWQN